MKKSLLSEADIRWMINAYVNDKISCRKIGQKYKTSPARVSEILKENGIIIKSGPIKLYPCDEKYFSNINSQEKAYFLGLMYSDGYNCVKKGFATLALSIRDQHILERFREELKTQKPFVYEYKSKQNSNWSDICRFRIDSDAITSDLARLGCVQKKSLILEFPSEVQVSKDFLKYFILGYFDGDGSTVVYKVNNKWKIQASLTSTHDFCKKCLDFISGEIGISGSITQVTKSGFTYTLNISGNNQVLAFLTWLYQDASIFLHRKYNKFVDGKKQIDLQKRNFSKSSTKVRKLLGIK